jgi:hypothetical protein
LKRNVFIIGGLVAVLVLACVAAVILFGSLTRYGADNADQAASYPERSGVAPAAMEVAVDRAMEAPPAEPRAYGGAGSAYAAERLIIRSGNVSLVVTDTRAALATIEGIVQGMAAEGAFVVSADEVGGEDGSQPRITVSIRIPASRFDETMDRLAALAVSVANRSESSQDVTEEYVDLEARVESLETARQRLLEIMEEARSTKDLLEAEQQLTQREAEIESLKGRKQYLEQSARLSNIWIELQPYLLSQPVGDEWRPAETVRRAVEALLDGLRGFGDFLIVFAIAVLPWLAALGLVVFLVVRLVRWRARVRRARQPGPASD